MDSHGYRCMRGDIVRREEKGKRKEGRKGGGEGRGKG